MNGKLVRDKIPDIIRSDGRSPAVRTLDGEAYVEELRRKLVEEASEYAETGDLEELADVLEVVYALADVHRVPMAEVETLRARKREARGGFTRRLFLLNAGD